MRVLFLINSLGRGGAELNLVRLAGRLRDRGIDVEIASLTGAEPDVVAEARGLGVPTRLNAWASVMLGALSRHPPDLVDGWQYGGAVAANVFRMRHVPVTWSLRHVPLAYRDESRSTRFCLTMLRWLPSPARVIVNSQAGVDAHRRLGIEGAYQVIPNGIDTQRFAADEDAGRDLRRTLGIADSSFVLLHVARFHPHKGHAQLLEAFAGIASDDRDIRLICMGQGVSKIASLARQLGVDSNRLYLLEPNADLRATYAAADVVVSPSLTESFPTVVAEAMSCERPCIVTDVGESANIVHDTGWLVRSADVAALRDTIWQVSRTSPRDLLDAGRRARQRIVEHFSEDRLVRAYSALAEDIVGGRR